MSATDDLDRIDEILREPEPETDTLQKRAQTVGAGERMKSALYLYTIYRDPLDYPKKWVVRRFTVEADASMTKDAAPLAVVDTLKEARESLPFGVYNLGRERGDAPKIYETWV